MLMKLPRGLHVNLLGRAPHQAGVCISQRGDV